MTYKKKSNGNKIITLILLAVIAVGVFSSGYFLGTKLGKAVVNTEDSGETKNTVAEELSDEQIEKVDKIIEDMTLSDMVYQMMFVTPEAITGVSTVVMAGNATEKALEMYPVGGLVYFSDNFESRQQTAEMLANTQKFSEIPLFISVDEEGGIVSRLGSNQSMGTTKHPPMREIGDTKDPSKAYEVGATLASELTALGFNMDFAPVADVLINTENIEIGSRSFGTEPKEVSAMVESAVKGMEENGLSASLKHFPGHGSTTVNSHNGTAESTRTLDELKDNEFLPFEAGIDAGVDFIMISHMTLVEATEEKVPCSLSHEVITEWLKGDLGYKGIVITDAFNMGAVTEKYSAGEAAVKAVEAGVDMILMTPDLQTAHTAIVNAVESGKIPQERIEESVRKILLLKAQKGLLD